MSYNVLMVEDSEDLLRCWEKIFPLTGNQIVCRKNATEALQEIRGHSYDVIVCDYYLPDMNGIQLLEEIRKLDKEVPYILLTGSKEATIEEQLKDWPNVTLLHKPIQFKELDENIKKLLAS